MVSFAEGPMSEIAPPRNLTPGLCKAIETEMLRACAEVAAKHGLVAEGLGLQALDLRWNFDFGALCRATLRRPSDEFLCGHKNRQRRDGAFICPSVRDPDNDVPVFHRIWSLGPTGHGLV